MKKQDVVLVKWVNKHYLKRTIIYTVGWYHSTEDEVLYLSRNMPEEIDDLFPIMESSIIKITVLDEIPTFSEE